MSARRTDMHRIQELIRLHRLGKSARRIARHLSMGRDTVREYLAVLQKSGILDDASGALPELDVLAALLRDHAPASEALGPVSTVDRWRDEVVRLRAKGAGPTAIHDHLRVNQPDYAGSLSAVKRMCLRLERAEGPKAVDVAIPVDTAAGEIAQVDFGYAGKRYDPERGILRKTWLFVMTLGYSRRSFCALVFDQKIETWIRLHIEAFEYFGGVPRVIVPDNLKAAVVRAAFGVDDDPVIQRSYRELARHYGFQIDPTPPRSPQKKGKDEAVGSAMTSALRGVTADAAVVPPAVLRHVYLAWLDSVYRTTAELRFSPRDLEGLRAEFRALDARFPHAARERVRSKCLARYPSSGSGSPNRGQLGTLRHELSKKKRQLPVRKLVAAVPHLLQALKPCFMMSPLAVSQYLPRGATDDDTLSFDTVIFDEASQVFPEDAVPAMARGSQLIVVGDRKQLPPSSFFRKDDGENSDEDSEDEEPTSSNRLVGVESVLDVLVGMHGSGVDEVYLEVHYRSRHDALIRYSNHYFYEDRLLTFPSALPVAPGLGLRSVYLADGRFDAGATRTNRIEAEKVVDLVLELMEQRPPEESIGVVALSRAQADLIEQLLDERRRSDRRFDGRFSDDAHERFFVKNLENVQGDERDHVILSVGYGPTKATGVVPNRFGPVNAEGGHRRLNVAVSRARRSMTVVHSLRAEDIRSESEGARLLRRYL